MSDFNFRNGKRCYHAIHNDFYYSNGKRAFHAIHGDVYYMNGKRAYHGIFRKAFYENGNELGRLPGASYASNGVEINLGDDSDSFECDLGEGMCLHIQIGRRGKSFQLYGANGGAILDENI